MDVGKALKRCGCICGVKWSNDESCRSRDCSLWCPEMATNRPIEILAWPSEDKRNNCVKTSHCTTCGTTLLINTIKVNVITFPEIHQKKLFLSFVCVNN